MILPSLHCNEPQGRRESHHKALWGSSAGRSAGCLPVRNFGEAKPKLRRRCYRRRKERRRGKRGPAQAPRNLLIRFVAGTDLVA